MTYSDNYAAGTATSSSLITAFFDSRTDAEHAIERLVDAGIPRQEIRIVADDSEAGRVEPAGEHKGFWASLEDLFFPDDDRSVYAEGIRRGGFLVSVSGFTEAQQEQVLDILDDEGSVDLDERAQSWESEGWSRTSSATSSAAYESGSSFADGSASGSLTEGSLNSGSAGLGRSSTLEADGKDVIPVVEEELRVGKRDINNGRVRVRSYTREIPVSENLSLRDENVEVTRRTVDRPLSDADSAFVDRTIEAEEHREEAVISKEARVVEEIELRKTATQREETVSDTVRKTEVEVEDDRDLKDKRFLRD